MPLFTGYWTTTPPPLWTWKVETVTEPTDDADDLIAEQATKAPPPEPVPDAAALPSDVKDGVAGEPDSDSPDADDGSDAHTEDE